MGASAARIATRIANLETAQDVIDTASADRVAIGDKSFQITPELRKRVSEELEDLYEQQAALAGTGGRGFTVSKFQRATR